METLQHNQQRPQDFEPALDLPEVFNKDLAEELVWDALSHGYVVPTSPDGLQEIRDSQASAILEWLLDTPEEVIEHSFEDKQALTTLIKSDTIQQEELPEVQQLQMFNLNFVRDVTGMSAEQAAEVVTNRSAFVSTIMNGLARSQQYWDRSHVTNRQPMEDGTSGDTIEFAAQYVEPTDKPEWIASIGRKMVAKDGKRQSVQTYHVESSLRDHKNGVSYVMEMEEGEEPRVLQKYWKGGMYHYKPFEDSETEQQHFITIFGDMAIAFRNHDQKDNKLAYSAAKRGTRV